jgi:hypothetical protein
MNPRTHITKFVLSAVAVAVAGAALAAIAFASGRPQVTPNPVTFTGQSIKTVSIANTGSADSRWQVSVSAGAPRFRLIGSTTRCRLVHAAQRCAVKVGYSPSGNAEDRGTLRIRDQLSPQGNATVDLIGHPGSGGPPPGGGNGPSCTLHVGRHQKLVKRAGGKTVRTPYQVSLTQSDDGTVSARATGKTKAGKSISLDSVSSPATAGNGVVMKMKLPRSSESRIRAELAAGRNPKMTLAGTCTGANGSTVEHAVIHFSDGKGGRGFKLPLEADARAK